MLSITKASVLSAYRHSLPAQTRKTQVYENKLYEIDFIFKFGRIMSAKNKTGTVATVLAVISFLLVLIAFVTPCWLENDSKARLDGYGEPRQDFVRLGLWEVCFNGMEDPRHYYDTVFVGCWWVFEEEYYIIHQLLLPGFFVATQFFFTLCFTLLLISAFLVALFVCCSRDHDRYALLSFIIGADLVLAGVSGTLAVIIFGAYGDGRVWMPDWEHNNLSWSYALAVVGSLLLLVAGTLYLVEGRVVHRKRKSLENPQGEFNIQFQKRPQSSI